MKPMWLADWFCSIPALNLVPREEIPLLTMAPAWEVPSLMNLNETYISESASIIKPLWRGISTSLGLTIASVHAADPFAGWSEIVTSTGMSFET